MQNFFIKTIVLQILIIVYCPGQTPGWEVIQSNTNENLNSIYFYDYQTGFACGNSGVVLKTLDSGKTWQTLQSPFLNNLNDCFMFSQECVVAVGDSSIVVNTSDGGNMWNTWWLTDLVDNINCISFIKEQNRYSGFYGADSQAILFGDFDGYYCYGFLYNIWGGHETGAFWASYMFKPGMGFVVGENSQSQPILGRTTNFGNNWDFISFYLNGQNGRATGVSFTDSLVGYISAQVWDGRGAIARTTNSGYEWTTKFFNYPLWSINFPISGSNQVGYCVGDSGTILKTFNAGETWHTQSSGTSEKLNKVHFLDSDFGFAVGDNGVILRTTNGGGSVSNIKNTNNNLYSMELQQNYPNPFNPSTNIKFRIANFGFASLIVYDVLGNEVATLVNEEKPAGEYKVEFSVGQESFPVITSGIYFYQLRAGSFMQTKKMILLK